LIRHADLSLTITVGTLTVAMVEFALKTLLVFAIGLPALLAPYVLTAPTTAVPVAPGHNGCKYKMLYHNRRRSVPGKRSPGACTSALHRGLDKLASIMRG